MYILDFLLRGKRRCHTEEGEKAVWSVEYETVRGCEGTVPRLAEVTVECDVGSGEEVESWSVGELEEMEEGKSMLKERKWVSPSPGRRFPAGSSGPAGRRTAAAVTTAQIPMYKISLNHTHRQQARPATVSYTHLTLPTRAYV